MSSPSSQPCISLDDPDDLLLPSKNTSPSLYIPSLLSLISSGIIQHILSYLQPHLPARLVCRSWDTAIQDIHSLSICTSCNVQCKSHNAVQRRHRIPWNPRWVIRGRYDDQKVFNDNPRLFECVTVLKIGFQPSALSEGQLSALLSTLYPSSIKELVLSQKHLSEHDISAIANCPNLSLLTHLCIPNAPLSLSSVLAIATSPHLSQLECLTMRLRRASPAVAHAEFRQAAAILSSTPSLANLKFLDLSFPMYIGEVAVKSFAQSLYLTNLVDLRGAFVTQPEPVFAHLMNSSYADRVQRLFLDTDALVSIYASNDNGFKSVKDLTLSWISSSAVDSLLSSTHRLKSVTSLTIRNIINLSFSSVASCPALFQLKELTIAQESLRKDDNLGSFSLSEYQLTSLKSLKVTGKQSLYPLINDMSCCLHFSTLTCLSLSSPQIGDEDIFALCASPYFQHLQSLRLPDSTGIGPNGFQALGSCTNFPSLMSLDLSSVTGVGAVGWSYLKNISLYLTSLTALDLSFCELGDECIIALTTDSNLHSIRSLNLQHNSFTINGFNIIGCCASLVGLNELNLCHALVSPVSEEKAEEQDSGQEGDQEGVQEHAQEDAPKLFEMSCLTNLTRLSLHDCLSIIPFSTIEEFVRSSPIMTSMRVLEMDISATSGEMGAEPGRSSRYVLLHSILDSRLELLHDRFNDY